MRLLRETFEIKGYHYVNEHYDSTKRIFVELDAFFEHLYKVGFFDRKTIQFLEIDNNFSSAIR